MVLHLAFSVECGIIRTNEMNTSLAHQKQKEAPRVAAPGAFFVQIKFARGNFYKNMQVFAYYICKWLDRYR